jgi:transcriptional regulator with XRE-family HTH domain
VAITDDGAAIDACFGENLRKLRQVQGISMRALQEKTGVSFSVISKIEHGHGTTLRNAKLLADGLGSSLGEMCSADFLDQSVRALSYLPVEMGVIKEALDQEKD